MDQDTAEAWLTCLRLTDKREMKIHTRGMTCPARQLPDGTWSPELPHPDERCIIVKSREGWVHLQLDGQEPPLRPLALRTE